MRRSLVILVVLALAAIAAPAALATTQQASSGAVTATFTFHGKYPNYKGLRLRITRSGSVAYDQAVSSTACGSYCAPGAADPKASSVQVIDLAHSGEPNVVLDLYSGGAHCCSIAQVFTYNAATQTYTMAEHNFGDPGYRVQDLGHNGQYEWVTADDQFAYAFTDFAASGMPVQVLSFTGGRFVDVTQSYLGLVRHDAALWLKAYKQGAHRRWIDTVGIIAAWAADEDRLGHSTAVDRYLRAQARAGHLNGATRSGPRAQLKFVARLEGFLRRHGYVH